MLGKTFIDLFAGLGGFRLALEAEGLQCVFSSDIDRRIRENYRNNFNDDIAGDITAIDADDIPVHDILCAGFPCQSFSTGGKNLGFADVRGQLFYEIIRIAKHHQPKIMLLENVRGLLKNDGGKSIVTIYKALENIGYKITHALLKASHYNIPQGRWRVYFVAIRNDIPLAFTPPQKVTCTRFLNDILLTPEEIAKIDPEKIRKTLLREQDEIVIKDALIPSNQARAIPIGHVNKYRQGNRIFHSNGHACTQMSRGENCGWHTGFYMIDGEVRGLHVIESLRLQGFPDDWSVSDGWKGYSQIGNAIIPAMVRLVYNSIHCDSIGGDLISLANR